jgi:hypothetical protein
MFNSSVPLGQYMARYRHFQDKMRFYNRHFRREASYILLKMSSPPAVDIGGMQEIELRPW